jgi:hypothetical protein
MHCDPSELPADAAPRQNGHARVDRFSGARRDKALHHLLRTAPWMPASQRCPNAFRQQRTRKRNAWRSVRSRAHPLTAGPNPAVAIHPEMGARYETGAPSLTLPSRARERPRKPVASVLAPGARLEPPSPPKPNTGESGPLHYGSAAPSVRRAIDSVHASPGSSTVSLSRATQAPRSASSSVVRSTVPENRAMGVPRPTPLLTSPYARHRSCDESTLPVCRRVVSTNPTTKAPTATVRETSKTSTTRARSPLVFDARPSLP